MKNKISIIILSVLFSILIWGTVTLSDQFYSTKDFDVKVINQPTGYACGVTNPEKISVKIKARGWQLLTLGLGPQTEYLVSADKDSGLITVDPFNEVDENTWLSAGLSVAEISPREISFKVERLKYKRLKIEAETDLSFSDEYGLATPIRVYPDSVLVEGPSSVLDKISEIKTKLVKLSALDNKIKLITDIEEPEGFKLEQNKAELTIDVQRIVEKTFENVKVIIKDIPKDRDVVLIPNTINCSLRGGINILGKINPNEITASLDYREIVYDTLGSVQPNVVIPKNTQLVFIKPVRLNYIIKKFE
ncbi:MAG TPA: CdaR family protein [Ignavibacteriaceae bacterium]